MKFLNFTLPLFALAAMSIMACSNPLGKSAKAGANFHPGYKDEPVINLNEGIATIAFTVQPSATGTTGTALAVQPVVTAFDEALNIVTENSIAEITLYAMPTADCSGAPLTGGITATANPGILNEGVVEFSGVTVQNANAIRIKAVAGPFTACSDAIAITPTAPTSLALHSPTTSPGGADVEIEVGGAQDTVDVYLYTDCGIAPVGMGTADGSTAIVSATLAEGSYTLYAKHRNAVGVYSACSTASVNYAVDLTPPVLDSVTITNTSPTNSQTYNLTFGTITGTYSHYCILENSTTVGSCTWVAGTVPATFGVAATNNAKVLSVWLKDSIGNVSTRVDSNSVTLDNLAPSLASFSLSASGSSMIQTPTVTATVTEVHTPTTNFYVSSSSTPNCAGGSIGSTTDKSISLVLGNVGTSGEKYIHYISSDSATSSNATVCTYTGLHYSYLSSPYIAFSKSSFLIQESDGAYIDADDKVTLVRVDASGNLVSGATSALTVTPSALTRRSGFNTSAIVVNFGSSDTAVTIPAASFTVTDDATYTEDQYARLSIACTSACSDPVDASTKIALRPNPVAKLMVVDSDAANVGTLVFEDTLFTAIEGDSSLSVRVYRTGSTVGDFSGTLGFMDGSATAGTHYGSSGTTCTVSTTPNCSNYSIPFTISNGLAYVDVSVPLLMTDNSTAGDSKSFYIKILSTTPGEVRANSMAKIRILDKTEFNAVANINSGSSSPICNGTNTTTGTNNGFGANVSSTRYVCSQYHLYRLGMDSTTRSYNSKFFADLVLDYSTDADPNTGGTQTLEPIGLSAATSYKGNLDGNERIIYGVTNNSNSTQMGGLFYRIGSSTAQISFRGVNLEMGQMPNHKGNNAGLMASNIGLSGYLLPNYYDNYVSGYLNIDMGDPNGHQAMHFGYIATTMASSAVFRNLFSAGLNNGYASTAGIFSSVYSGSTGNITLALSNLMNVATVKAQQSNASSFAAGITTGLANSNASSVVTLTTSENRGAIQAIGAANGIIHSITPVAGQNYSVTKCANYGPVTSTLNAGNSTSGIVGEVSSATANLGSTTYTFNHLYNYGTIAGGGSRTAGVISTFAPGSGMTATLSNLYNYGDITSSNDYVGGVIGQAYNRGTSTSSITISNSGNFGNVTSNSGATNTGGFAGVVGIASNAVGTSAVANASITLSKVFSMGATITADGHYAGGLIAITFNGCQTAGLCNFLIEKSYVSGGSVSTTGSWTGGFVGYVNTVTNGTSVFNDNYSTTTINADSFGTGGFGNHADGTGSITASNFYYGGTHTNLQATKGGIFYTKTSTPTYSNMFYLDTNPTDTVGSTLTSAQMNNSSDHATNFPGFNFSTIWNPPSGSAPPTLR